MVALVSRLAALEAKQPPRKAISMILRMVISDGPTEYLGVHAAPPWLPEAVDRAEGETWDDFVVRVDGMLAHVPVDVIPRLLARDDREERVRRE